MSQTSVWKQKSELEKEGEKMIFLCTNNFTQIREKNASVNIIKQIEMKMTEDIQAQTEKFGRIFYRNW